MVAILGSYLFGGIPIGLLVGRAKGIEDIRKYGSGNIGASNVLRVIGVKAGIFVWLMDALKGFAPVLVARYVFVPGGSPAEPLALWWLGGVALASMAGHCCSPYLRFTGGRGVSTSLGVILGLDWRVGVICFACWIVIVAVTRYISLGSIVGTTLAPLLLIVFHAPLPFIVAITLVAVVVDVRHISNIQRLLSGTERKIGHKEQAPSQTESPQ